MIGIFAIVLNILIFFLQMYSLFIVVYIILSWVPNSEMYPIRSFMGKFCEPYLELFRVHRFLVLRNIDFGPLVALIVLSIIRSLFILLLYGKFTVLAILFTIISIIWDPIAFFMTLYLICIAMRYAGFIFAPHSLHPFWHALDILINPALNFISCKLYPNRIVRYEVSLFSTLLILVALRFGIGTLMYLLGRLAGF